MLRNPQSRHDGGVSLPLGPGEKAKRAVIYPP